MRGPAPGLDSEQEQKLEDFKRSHDGAPAAFRLSGVVDVVARRVAFNLSQAEFEHAV